MIRDDGSLVLSIPSIFNFHADKSCISIEDYLFESVIIRMKAFSKRKKGDLS